MEAELRRSDATQRPSRTGGRQARVGSRIGCDPGERWPDYGHAGLVARAPGTSPGISSIEAFELLLPMAGVVALHLRPVASLTDRLVPARLARVPSEAREVRVDRAALRAADVARASACRPPCACFVMPTLILAYCSDFRPARRFSLPLWRTRGELSGDCGVGKRADLLRWTPPFAGSPSCMVTIPAVTPIANGRSGIYLPARSRAQRSATTPGSPSKRRGPAGEGGWY